MPFTLPLAFNLAREIDAAASAALADADKDYTRVMMGYDEREQDDAFEARQRAARIADAADEALRIVEDAAYDARARRAAA